MPISKCRPRSRAVGVLVAFAVFASVAGCAGSGERLPQCRGRSVPINVAGSHVASTVSVSETDAH
jgi:hypothetical protein